MRLRGLTAKFLMASVGTLWVLGFVLAIVLNSMFSHQLFAFLQKEGVYLARSGALEVVDPILMDDDVELHLLIDRYKEIDENIEYVFIVDSNRRVLSHSFEKGFPVELKDSNIIEPGQSHRVQSLDTGQGIIFDIAAPIVEGKLGEIHIGISEKPATLAVIQIEKRMVGVFLFFIAGIIVLQPVIFNRVVIKPLNTLAWLMWKGADNFQTRWPNPHLLSCWKFRDCQEIHCPAYKNPNLRCWHIAGTLCEDDVQGVFARKIGDCRKCEVYKAAHVNQIVSLGEQFNNMLQLLTIREHKLKAAQSQLVLNEKMASLGVLSSGIAHEINTPTGAIINSSRELQCKLEALFKGIDALADLNQKERDLLQVCLVDLTKEGGARQEYSWKKIQQIRRYLAEFGVENYKEVTSVLVKFNLLDEEKIERYKTLWANPSILRFMEAVGTVALAQNICQVSAHKIAGLVKALKYYAYTDMDKVGLLDINEGIENVLMLMGNKFKGRFDIIKDFGELPKIYCTNEINQVWTNLLSNAYDAIMEMREGYQGEIIIETRENKEHLIVKIRDNGSGISAEKMDKIFDPFFTTKEIGKGLGLGLSIVSGIVKKNAGEISVKSIPGNTTFTVLMPKEGKGHV